MVDAAATACGRVLVAGDKALMLADTDDDKMSYEEWLQDEFNQYVLYIKTMCWPDDEPVGWVVDVQRRKGLSRFHPASTDSAGWAIQILMLADAINGDPEANNVSTLFNLFNPNRPPADRDAFNQRIAAPPVPCTAIFTREDGIVAWQCSQEEEGPMTENVEVQGTHVGLPWNPLVLAAIAERLPRTPLPGELP